MMIKIWSGRYLAFCLTVAFLCISANILLPTALAQEQMGHLTVTGKVLVKRQPAATGDIVSSGSTVQTAKGSSAVVSLGKLGRVEIFPETRMKLTYDEASISISLDFGRVQITKDPGVSATVTHKED